MAKNQFSHISYEDKLKSLQEKVNKKRGSDELIVLSHELRKATEKSSQQTTYIKVKFIDSDIVYEVVANNISPTSPRKGKLPMNNKKYTKETYVNLIHEEKPFIEMLGEYNGKHEKTLFKNTECGHEFESSPHYMHWSNCICPICKNNISFGELLIKKYFDEKNVEYVVQKQFDGMIHIRPLKIDVYVPSSNTAIEFQGRQHFEDTESLFRDTEGFELIKLRDQIKYDFCKDNNINIVYLDYTMIKNGKLNDVAINILNKI